VAVDWRWPLKRLVIAGAVLVCVVTFTLDALSGSRWHRVPVPQPQPQPRALGAGVTLLINRVDVQPTGDGLGIVEVSMALDNHGRTPLTIGYGDFSLSDRRGERYLALLPSEVNGSVGTEHLLREGILDVGASRSAVLCFYSPSRGSGPIDLRVDLVGRDGVPVSEAFVPLFSQ
jgi:hypothetical protein